MLPFLVIFGVFSECSVFRDMSQKHSTRAPCAGRGHRGGGQSSRFTSRTFSIRCPLSYFSGICPSMQLSIRAAINSFYNVCKRTFFDCRGWRAHSCTFWLHARDVFVCYVYFVSGVCMRQVASAAHNSPPKNCRPIYREFATRASMIPVMHSLFNHTVISIRQVNLVRKNSTAGRT